MSVALITAAAYINQEMAAEFGPLPPAFLPLGNARLFRLQAELLRQVANRIVLSLPQSFTPSPQDARLLATLGVTVVQIPDGLALAESVMLALISSTADATLETLMLTCSPAAATIEDWAEVSSALELI